jgi:hypothetical protein
MVKKNYKIKLSGSKLKIISSTSCVSVDLDMFAVLKIEQKQKDVCFLDGDKLFSSASFDTVTDAKEAHAKIIKKVFRKNKKFRASVFIAQILMWLCVLFLLLNFLSVSMGNRRDRARQQAFAQQQQKQQVMHAAQQQNDTYEIYSDIDKAQGQGASISDVFSIK